MLDILTKENGLRDRLWEDVYGKRSQVIKEARLEALDWAYRYKYRDLERMLRRLGEKSRTTVIDNVIDRAGRIEDRNKSPLNYGLDGAKNESSIGYPRDVMIGDHSFTYTHLPRFLNQLSAQIKWPH